VDDVAERLGRLTGAAYRLLPVVEGRDALLALVAEVPLVLAQVVVGVRE
jgi:hypothetical protein